MKRVAIAGVTGYSGQVLKELVDKHPHFELTALIGREEKIENLKGKCDIAFLCTPAETSLDLAPQLLEIGIHVVDVSGAFRLKQHSYPEWYSFDHTAKKLLEESVYGLFPFNETLLAKKVDSSTKPILVANPGCYATASLLGLIPLLKSGLIDENNLSLDGKSGTSGAGRQAKTDLLFTEIFGNFYPYRLGRHQHWPEIVEAALGQTQIKINPVFVTELLPIERGISLCIFARWKNPAAKNQLPKLLEAFQSEYAGSPEIEVGTDCPELLSLKRVCGKAGAQIHVSEAYGAPLVFVSIDNLMRGAASQALMNANILAKRPSSEGLL